MWVPEHTEEFNAIRKGITSAPIVKYYDPRKSLTLQPDISLKVIDAVLFQESHPVYFASSSLQPHQKPYVAIELKSQIKMLKWSH